MEPLQLMYTRIPHAIMAAATASLPNNHCLDRSSIENPFWGLARGLSKPPHVFQAAQRYLDADLNSFYATHTPCTNLSGVLGAVYHTEKGMSDWAAADHAAEWFYNDVYHKIYG